MGNMNKTMTRKHVLEAIMDLQSGTASEVTERIQRKNYQRGVPTLPESVSILQNMKNEGILSYETGVYTVIQ